MQTWTIGLVNMNFSRRFERKEPNRSCRSGAQSKKEHHGVRSCAAGAAIGACVLDTFISSGVGNSRC